MRLDVDHGFSKTQVSDAFSGAEELEIEVWQAMFGAADLTALRLFEGVRGVMKAKVSGSVGRGYAAWLEGVMMADYGVVVGEMPDDKEKGPYDIWTHGNR